MSLELKFISQNWLEAISLPCKASFRADRDKSMTQNLVGRLVPGAAGLCGSALLPADRELSFSSVCSLPQYILRQSRPGDPDLSKSKWREAKEGLEWLPLLTVLEFEIHVHFLGIENGCYFLQTLHGD